MWPLRHHLEKILMRHNHLLRLCFGDWAATKEHWYVRGVPLSTKWPSHFVTVLIVRVSYEIEIYEALTSSIFRLYHPSEWLKQNQMLPYKIFKNAGVILMKKCLRHHCISKNSSCTCQQLSTQPVLSVSSIACTVLHLWSQLLKSINRDVSHPPKRIVWQWHIKSFTDGRQESLKLFVAALLHNVSETREVLPGKWGLLSEIKKMHTIAFFALK